jgi:hypothetical protein
VSEHRRRSSSHGVGHPNTQDGNTRAQFKSEGENAQNVCCPTRSDDSHRQRVSILT